MTFSSVKINPFLFYCFVPLQRKNAFVSKWNGSLEKNCQRFKGGKNIAYIGILNGIKMFGGIFSNSQLGILTDVYSKEIALNAFTVDSWWTPCSPYWILPNFRLHKSFSPIGHSFCICCVNMPGLNNKVSREKVRKNYRKLKKKFQQLFN